MRAIVIAGTHSGCGKTTVTLGLLAALRKRGIVVQPFKAGPDFIDAGLHRIVTDRPSRNLDIWMCGHEAVLDSFNRHTEDADIAVIEGVMGMHDGDISTAGLARLLQAPIILVVDASGMAESAGAVVKGFSEFGVKGENVGRCEGEKRENTEGGLNFVGVIFNRVASENHFRRLKNSVCGVPVLGYLPRELNFEIPHRHLGLTVAEESPLSQGSIDKLAESVLDHVDVDRIMRIAECGIGVLEIPRSERKQHKGKSFNLAVAYDKAFCFYYEDNLDLLRDSGANIIKFSPLIDSGIPDDADAVYIGGGYPEIHAAALSGNALMLRSVNAWAYAGKPLYAECGGLMYLSKGVRDFNGNLFTMAGVFPFETRMMRKPRLGYREILLNEDCILGSKGEKCRGHEFHYSEILNGKGMTDDGRRTKIYAVQDKTGEYIQEEGYRFQNTLASYVHIHFGSNRRIADNFATYVEGERIA